MNQCWSSETLSSLYEQPGNCHVCNFCDGRHLKHFSLLSGPDTFCTCLGRGTEPRLIKHIVLMLWKTDLTEHILWRQRQGQSDNYRPPHLCAAPYWASSVCSLIIYSNSLFYSIYQNFIWLSDYLIFNHLSQLLFIYSFTI